MFFEPDQCPRCKATSKPIQVKDRFAWPGNTSNLFGIYDIRHQKIYSSCPFCGYKWIIKLQLNNSLNDKTAQ